MTKALLRYGLVLLALLLGVSAAAAQDDIDLPLPEIPPGQEVTVTYQVRVNEDLPPNLSVISQQGTVIGANFGPVLTDDPATEIGLDATLTQLGFNLGVAELPATGEPPWWP